MCDFTCDCVLCSWPVTWSRCWKPQTWNTQTGRQNEHSCTSWNGRDPSVTFIQTDCWDRRLQKSLSCRKAIDYAVSVVRQLLLFSKVPMILVPQPALHKQFILRYRSWESDRCFAGIYTVSKKNCTPKACRINSVIFQIQKNPKYTFCREFCSE